MKGGNKMSIEENKALVRRFCELENRGEVDALFELLAPGYVSHYTTGDMPLDKQFWATFSTAFPDISFTMEHLIAEGDKVAFRETWTGTHKGEFMGIPPTGKKVEMINTCIIRIADGKYAESWCTLDELRLSQQLGVIPEQ